MNTGAIISGVLTIIGLLLKMWFDRRPQRDQEKRNEDIQSGRNDIAAGDTDAVSVRIDRVLAPAAGDSPAITDDQDTARRLEKFT